MTQYRLCECCKDLDVRALLQAAKAAPSKPNINQNGDLTSAQAGLVYSPVARFLQHQPNISALKDSALACDLCSAIWKDYGHARQPSELKDSALQSGLARQPIYIGTLVWDTGSNPVPHLAFNQYSSDNEAMSRQVACFEVCAEHGLLSMLPENDRSILSRVQASSADDPQCFELARQWVKTCHEEHRSCRHANTSDIRRPTRLLDVFPGQDPPDQTIRLVQGAESEGSYTALSYCWGPDRDLVLTQESEMLLRSGAELARFPGTLRDAIIVTRKLGIRYIWIDALCIFQDQKERQEAKDDWAREAGRMRDVYRGAVVTIEASSATRGGEGFLSSRDSSKPYCALPWRSSDVPGSCVYLRPMTDITDNQLLGTILYTRGWTLQERLLAPRTLSFGKQQISFQCAGGYVDETGRTSMLPRPSELYLSKEYMRKLRQDTVWHKPLWRSFSRWLGMPPVVTLLRFKTITIGWSSRGQINTGGGNWETYYEYWRDIVERYSERQLTGASDRLPALSGLADEFQRATGDTYIAGMWKDELLVALAWKCMSVYNSKGEYGKYSGVPLNSIITEKQWPDDLPWPDCVRISSYVAPSWSWASVRGRVTTQMGRTNDDRPMKVYAKIRSVTVKPLYDTDPLGGLESAQLVLEAPFIWIPNPFDSENLDTTYPGIFRRIWQDVMNLSDDLASEPYQHHLPYGGQEFGLVKLFEDDPRHSQRFVRGRLLQMLLIETDGQGNWRRLACVDQAVDTLAELEHQHFGHWIVHGHSDEEHRRQTLPRLEEVAKVSREVETAHWQLKTLTLV